MVLLSFLMTIVLIVANICIYGLLFPYIPYWYNYLTNIISTHLDKSKLFCQIGLWISFAMLVLFCIFISIYTIYFFYYIFSTTKKSNKN